MEKYLSDDIIIDGSNFHEYFFDINTKPKKGHILAKYSSIALLVSGEEKIELINLLKQSDKAVSATQFMKNVLGATEIDSLKVPMKICEDLLNGSTDKEILKKRYKFQLELYYYTWPECVPHGDPHWEIISLKNLDKFLEDSMNGVEFEKPQ